MLLQFNIVLTIFHCKYIRQLAHLTRMNDMICKVSRSIIHGHWLFHHSFYHGLLAASNYTHCQKQCDIQDPFLPANTVPILDPFCRQTRYKFGPFLPADKVPGCQVSKHANGWKPPKDDNSQWTVQIQLLKISHNNIRLWSHLAKWTPAPVLLRCQELWGLFNGYKYQNVQLDSLGNFRL